MQFTISVCWCRSSFRLDSFERTASSVDFGSPRTHLQRMHQKQQNQQQWNKQRGENMLNLNKTCPAHRRRRWGCVCVLSSLQTRNPFAFASLRVTQPSRSLCGYVWTCGHIVVVRVCVFVNKEDKHKKKLAAFWAAVNLTLRYIACHDAPHTDTYTRVTRGILPPRPARIRSYFRVRHARTIVTTLTDRRTGKWYLPLSVPLSSGWVGKLLLISPAAASLHNINKPKANNDDDDDDEYWSCSSKIKK